MAVKYKYVVVSPYIIQEGDCTIVDVAVDLLDEDGSLAYSHDFSASAVRNPIDKANSDAGALIALGRALARAGERLQKVGNNFNKHDLDVKAARVVQAEKKSQHEALIEVSKISQEMGAYDPVVVEPDSGPGGEEVYD